MDSYASPTAPQEYNQDVAMQDASALDDAYKPRYNANLSRASQQPTARYSPMNLSPTSPYNPQGGQSNRQSPTRNNPYMSPPNSYYSPPCMSSPMPLVPPPCARILTPTRQPPDRMRPSCRPYSPT
jgi:dual specificity protein kinase YAK1